jgi:DNA polymerase III subunit gamma/tau
VVHTRSVSIKGVLKGRPRVIPVDETEIGETDQVAKDDMSAKEIVEITETDIQRVWSEYASSVEKTHPRISSTLNQQVPSMKGDDKIRIRLNTNAQREYFIHMIKPELTRFLRQNLADMEYVFEIELAENQNGAKKIYTDQDKLDYLISKNPELGKLKSRFNLDFDQ